MIATSHPKASLAGIEILRRGGSAVDAAIAATALLGVIEPGMTGIGGDCFAIVAKPGAEPVTINGSGRSPAGATLEFAARHAREGYPVAPRVAFDWGRNAERLRRLPATAAAFLPGGRAPREGDVHRQPALGATFEKIGRDGRAA